MALKTQLGQRYLAAMVMAGVGDSLGYYCGSWEFNFHGAAIHKEVAQLGGLAKLKNKSESLKHPLQL